MADLFVPRRSSLAWCGKRGDEGAACTGGPSVGEACVLTEPEHPVEKAVIETTNDRLITSVES